MEKRILHFPAIAASRHFSTPIWLRLWLVHCILCLTTLSASAQTTWTTQHQSPGVALSDIAYGAGRYVAVGGEGGGILRSSEDGNTWTTIVSDQSSPALIGIIYAAGKFVVVGSGGTVRTSTDGLTWVTQVSGTDKHLSSIAYGGGQFMAVGDEGIAITSTDAITWTILTTGTTTDFLDVTYGGSQFVIVGESGLIRTTPNGIIWTARTSGTSETLVSITIGKSGLFVAVGQSNVILTSPNGITWTPRSAPGSGALLDAVACNLTTGQFVVVSNHSNEVLTSPDGLTWSLTYSGTQLRLYGIRFINGQFIAVGDYGIIRSSLDGTAWKPLTVDYDMEFKGVAYGNGHYVAVGSYLTNPGNSLSKANVAVTSADAVQFVVGEPQQLIANTNGFNNVAFGNGLFAAVGENTNVQTSVDGKSWVSRYSMAGGKSLNGITYGGGRFVAVGDIGHFAQSTDGINWTASNSGSNSSYFDVIYANGQFIAAGVDGGGGSIGISTDGISWTSIDAGATNLTSVAYGNGTYVAVGLGGTVLRSTNGTVWTSVAKFTGSDINQITFDNNQFVTVGEDGEIFTSPNGMAWTERMTGTDGFKLNCIVHGNGLFVSVGDGATIVTSPDEGIAPPAGALTITGVTLVSCQTVSATLRHLVFTPQYEGLNGQPVSFSVVNEMVPTTNAGPYSLGMYIDNPTITLKATQQGTAGEATFTYNWLAACTGVPVGNQPPIAPSIANASGTVGQVFSQSIPPFTDPEGQPLTYSVTGLPPGLLVIGGGNMVGPPSTAGSYVITITATDPGGLSASATYTLTINPAGNNPGSFAITGVTLINCQTVTTTRRELVFTPQYDGISGQPVSFSVVNEMIPTTNAGPYSLGMYIDNPTITLKATQSGTPGEATFTYNWLAACQTTGARLGVSSLAERTLEVRVLGNPVVGSEAAVEIRGAAGQAIDLKLMDLQGKALHSQRIEQASPLERVSVPVDGGINMLLLEISTATERKLIKLIKP